MCKEDTTSHKVPYIAYRSRWKSFVDGQVSSNLLENFGGLPTPLIFKKKMCSSASTAFPSIYT